MHWCQTCNIFPKSAKDYLNHLHSKDHMDRESIETPWHADMVSDVSHLYMNLNALLIKYSLHIVAISNVRECSDQKDPHSWSYVFCTSNILVLQAL